LTKTLGNVRTEGYYQSAMRAENMAIDRNLLQFKRRNDQSHLDIRENRSGQKTPNRDQALRETEQRYPALLEEIEEGYFEANLEGDLVFINEPLCNISGYSKDALLGMNNREYTDSATAERMYELFSEIYRTGNPAKVKHFQIITKDGTKCILEISASLMRDSEGQPTGFRGIARNVTDRKHAEAALEETEKRYRSLFDESLDAIVITDRAGRFVDANKAALDLFGYSREEISRACFKELYVDPKDGARFQREAETKGSVRDFEVNLKKKDGAVMTCLLFVTAKHKNGGGIVGYQGIIRDITKTRATETALRQSEEKYRQILNHAPAGIYEIDFLKKTFVNVNDVMCEYTGYTKEELLSLSPLDILTEETKTRFMERITKLLAGEKVPETVEFKIKGKNDREFWVLLNSKLVYEDGFPKGATAVVHDITDRKVTEEALRRSEEKYRLLIDNANDGVFIEQSGRIKFPNPKTIQMLGYSADELTRIPYLDLVHPDDKTILRQAKEKSGTNGESASIYSIRVTNKTGRQVWAQISSVPIYWDDEPATLNFLRDVTLQKMAEDELRQTVEKLRKVTGATVQAMAHTVEVRDPYTAGHQKRVSHIARAIAAEMGLSSAMIEGIRMAGNIHDIGKISVPAEILSKPGILSDIQFALIKEHPATGYEILKGIEFPCDIARIVLQHHERMDGSGYPKGLCGEDILLEARILAVADVVEAMTSHRPYRPALGIEKALDEISSKKGKFYDPHAVDAFEKSLNKGNLELENG
jgi:PAS domain S-box-containing protein/putative nucleotidyltransferase with HDIG domain